MQLKDLDELGLYLHHCRLGKVEYLRHPHLLHLRTRSVPSQSFAAST